MDKPDYLTALIILAGMLLVLDGAIRKEESLALALVRALGIRRRSA